MWYSLIIFIYYRLNLILWVLSLTLIRRRACFLTNLWISIICFTKEEPAIEFYDGKIDEMGYRDLCQCGVWDIEQECLKYLRCDLECLFQVMHSYNQAIYSDFLVNAVKLSSYSALSKRVYTTNFYKDVGANIPVISGHLEDWIRRASKGGCCRCVTTHSRRGY